MADQVRVFVSHHHSTEEDAFTSRLVADLDAAGADVWVDDQRITSDDFIKKINEGLAGRQWLVLVMTPAALRSSWVQAEVNAALNQVRKGHMVGVVPILAQACDDEDIPPLLDALHRYDATHDYAPARDGLLRAVGLSIPTVPTAMQPSESVQDLQLHVHDLLDRAMALGKQERYADALPLVERAIQLDVTWWFSWYIYGGVLTHLRRYEEAHTAYDQVLAFDPNRYGAWLSKGFIYCYDQGRYEESLDCFDRALALDPDPATIWQHKGYALSQLGREEEAQAAWDYASELRHR